ncbi:MAG: glycosyltransferase family 2 protein [Eubacterium sp.]|nr:glycosyltransferase family 2 protein [Eubacterium sp.]
MEQNHKNEEKKALIWKVKKPIRLLKLEANWFFKRNRFSSLIRKTVKSYKMFGFRTTRQRIGHKLRGMNASKLIAKTPLFTDAELEQQRKHTFEKKIKYSIIVPLYNTPEKFLREMIESVLHQTYSNLELCMADGSDSEHGNVGTICSEYAEKDSRIKYKKLDKNYGISGNTNECLDMATGDYIGLFDHDDLLHPAALYEVTKTIMETGADFVYTDETTFHVTPKDAFNPHFKPDFAPDTLCGNNYICHFTVFKRTLMDEVGKFDPSCDGSQDHDFVLRLTEKAKRVAHIPEILYYWRAHPGSVAEEIGVKPYVVEAGIKAIERRVERMGKEGEVSTVAEGLTIYRVKYKIQGKPKVSILIPNYNHLEDLKKCLDSIFEKSSYQNYEIVIVENNSTDPEIFEYYQTLEQQENVKVVVWEGPFNYSAINNFGAEYCSGEYLILLNNDTEVIAADWIQEMLMFAQREDVGIVGAKLYYSDDTIQHAGLGIGLLGVAGHFFRGVDRAHIGYMGRLLYAQNLSAVTGACIMMRRDVWDEVSGLDETFAVSFNDVDLCMRVRKAGYLIVWTPFAELYHYESKSRGTDDTLKKQKCLVAEATDFQQRWMKELELGDPYYNPNFSLDREDFQILPVVEQRKAR